MSLATDDMDELDDRDRAVLEVLAGGRANPYLIRDETGLGKGDTNTVLNRLGRTGHVRQITRGLYDITDRGREEIDDPRGADADADTDADVEEATVDESDLRDRLQDARAARDRHEERADDLQARLDTAVAGPTPDRESLERVVCGVEAALMALDGRDPSIDAAKNELAAALETLQQLADD